MHAAQANSTRFASGHQAWALLSVNMSAPTKAMSRVAQEQRRFSLRLYKAILRTHQRALPPDMRHLGDSYVRQEFQLHKTAKAEHLRPFFDGWLSYLKDMSDAPPISEAVDVQIGRDMNDELVALLSEDQRLQLQQLKIESEKMARGEQPVQE